jgi:hypothetical protein
MTNFECGECGVKGIAGQVEHLPDCNRGAAQSDGDEQEFFHVDFPALETGGKVETELKDVDPDSRIAQHKVSTGALDRHQDIVEQSWDVTEYSANPVVLADHRYGIENIIGQNIDLKVKKVGTGETWAQTRFAETDKAQVAFDLVVARMAKAWSVGFKGMDFHHIVEGAKSKCAKCKAAKKKILNGRDEDAVWIHGRHFLKAKLYEYSLVVIPANPGAVMRAISKGLVDDNTAREFFRCTEEQPQQTVEELGEVLAGRLGIAVGEALKPLLEEIAGYREETATMVAEMIETITPSDKTVHVDVSGLASGEAVLPHALVKDALKETPPTKTKADGETPPPQDDKSTNADALKAKADKSAMPWSLSGKNQTRRLDIALKVKEGLRQDVRGRFLKHNTPRKKEE